MNLYKNFIKNKKGFTLIELLVVIGILAVLLAITLIAINPAKQFQQANNTKRQSDVGTILNAINQYMADNGGALPSGLTAGMAVTNIGNAVGSANICGAVSPDFIAALPFDPNPQSPATSSFTSCTAYDLQYTVTVSALNGRVTVSAPHTEPYTVATTDDITVTR